MAPKTSTPLNLDGFFEYKDFEAKADSCNEAKKKLFDASNTFIETMKKTCEEDNGGIFGKIWQSHYSPCDECEGKDCIDYKSYLDYFPICCSIPTSAPPSPRRGR